MIGDLAKAIGQARRVLVLAHRDPDGDALGSALGLKHLLEGVGKTVYVHRDGALPEEYAFLPGLEATSSELPAASEIDLAVLLDCHEPARAGQKAQALLESLPRVAVIDHHMGQVSFGQPRWVDPDMAATAQMVTLLAQGMGLPLSPQAATCLFVGLQTDTGRFCYSNTGPAALRVAADLVEAGARPWDITQEVYSSSRARLVLFGRVLASLKVLAGGRLALALARQADLEELGCPSSDLDRMVEELRAIRGVEVAALLKELADGTAKASLRSRGKVDVGALALELGGGGHHNASGARLALPLEQAAGFLAQRLENLLAQLPGGQA